MIPEASVLFSIRRVLRHIETSRQARWASGTVTTAEQACFWAVAADSSGWLVSSGYKHQNEEYVGTYT